MLHTPARRNPGSEEGFALMEVVVSAAVLIIVVLGVMAALDTVTGTAGANKARTVAATLAEKDQERLRGLRTTDLSTLDEIEVTTRKVKVDTVEYTIVSEAEYVADGSGEDISCAVPEERGSYLRITSTVTSPMTGTKVKPVVISSIVAPEPGKGTLTAMVTNAAGQPVVGLPVQATGPTSKTKITNDSGCAVFDESEAGSYIVKLAQTGWVDPDGNPTPQKSATVSAGNLTTVELVYDRASSFNVEVVTKLPGATDYQLDRSNGVIAAHTGLQVGTKSATAVDPGASTFAYPNMFPFATPYQVYSGRCTDADPVKAIPDVNHYTNHPESLVQLTPGGPTKTVYALEPAVDVTVKWNGGTTLSGNDYADVYAYPKACLPAAGTKVHLGRTSAAGKLTYPGLPFGKYDLCVEYTRTGTGGRTYKAVWTNMSNTAPGGTSWPVDFTTTSTRNACGASAP